MNFIFNILLETNAFSVNFTLIAEIIGGIVTIGGTVQWLWKKYVKTKEERIKELEKELKEQKEICEQLKIHNAEMKAVINMTSSYLNSDKAMIDSIKGFVDKK